MKKCPLCARTFDDAQAFCLTDGTPLSAESGVNLSSGSDHKRRKYLWLMPVILILAASATVVLLVYTSNRQNDRNQNNRQTVAAADIRPSPAQTPVPIPTQTPIAAPTPSSSATPSPESSPPTASPSPETNQAQTANSKTSTENAAAKPVAKIEDHNIVFNIMQCRKSGSSITCDFSLTNSGKDRDFNLNSYNSSLFDELGNNYRGASAQIANKTGGSPEIGFVSGVTAKAQMTFEGVEPNATKITLLRLRSRIGDDYGLDIRFRNVPLEIK